MLFQLLVEAFDDKPFQADPHRLNFVHRVDNNVISDGSCDGFGRAHAELQINTEVVQNLRSFI